MVFNKIKDVYGWGLSIKMPLGGMNGRVLFGKDKVILEGKEFWHGVTDY